MFRTFLFLLGFGFMVIGFTYIITYLNLLNMGYSFNLYLKYILGRMECLLSIIGFIIIFAVIITKGEYDGIHLWYFT